MVPRQRLIEGAVPVDVGVDVDSARLRSRLPTVEVEVFGPLLERAAVTPDVLDHRSDATVPPAGQALSQAGRGIVPLELDAPGPAQVVAQQADLATQLHHGVLAEPLERSEGLGHEPAHRDGDRRRAGVGPTQRNTVAGQLGDGERVGVGLCGQPGHEVELHPAPPLRVGRLDRRVEIIVGDELVDHLAHAPGAGLGREGQPGPARPLDLSRDAHREGIDPQAGQRHRDLAAARVVDGVGHHPLDAAEVGSAQRGEGDLVVAGAPQALADHGAYLLGRTLAHGTGDHPGLAEAAAAGAAPEDLDVEPVVHHLGQRHELLLGVGPVGQIGHRALLDHGGHVAVARLDGHQPAALVDGLVHGRHVDPGHPGQGPQHPGAPACSARRLPVPHHLGDVAHRLLAVAEHREVEEVGQRLGVVGAVAPGADQRIRVVPGSSPDGHTREIDAVQHVGVGELGREVEGDHVEPRSRTVGVQREQRQPLGPHQRFEVAPGRVGPLGGRVRAFVEDLVEDLQPLVRQAYLIGVRIGEQPRHDPGTVARDPHPVLGTDIAGRFGHLGQQRLKLTPQTAHCSSLLLLVCVSRSWSMRSRAARAAASPV